MGIWLAATTALRALFGTYISGFELCASVTRCIWLYLSIRSQSLIADCTRYWLWCNKLLRQAANVLRFHHNLCEFLRPMNIYEAGEWINTKAASSECAAKRIEFIAWHSPDWATRCCCTRMQVTMCIKTRILRFVSRTITIDWIYCRRHKLRLFVVYFNSKHARFTSSSLSLWVCTALNRNRNDAIKYAFNVPNNKRYTLHTSRTLRISESSIHKPSEIQITNKQAAAAVAHTHTHYIRWFPLFHSDLIRSHISPLGRASKKG